MRSILISGAAQGIGAAIARLFYAHHYKVGIYDINSAQAEQLAASLGPNAKAGQLDVSNYQDWQTALAEFVAWAGELNVLVNNAGNAHGLESISEGNIADWDAMMDGNVKGLLYVSQPIIKIMKARNTGHIINISSVAARQTYANGVVYCASKRAVDVISEGMRIELTEFGIKVTNIQPGAVETDFSKVRFKGDEQRAATVYAGYEALKAEDIADAISYCVNAPERVSIAELCIYPKAQAEPRTIHRK